MEPKLCLTFAGFGFRAPLSHPQPGTESPPRWTRELKRNPSLTCMSLSLNLTKPLIFRSFSDPKSQGREKNLHQNMVLILLLSDGIRSNYTQLPESPTIYSLNSPNSNKLNAPKFVLFCRVFRTSGAFGSRLWNRPQPTGGLVECGNQHTLRLERIAVNSV